MSKPDADGLDDLKEDMCFSSRALSTLKGRLKSGGALDVTELDIDADAPTNWINAPKLNVSVQKPKPDSIVAFCGANEPAQAADVVTGSPPEDAESNDLHVMIFTPVDK